MQKALQKNYGGGSISTRGASQNFRDRYTQA